jgi:cell division protein FtsQ
MPRRNKAEEPDRRERARRRARRAVQFTGWTLAIVAVVFAAAFLLVHGEQFVASDPRFRIAAAGPGGGPGSAITVTGVRHASMSSILDVFAEDHGRSLYRLDPEERRKALQRVEWVKDATVRRVWPNRVAVGIIERAPVAFLQIPARATGDAGQPVAYRPLLIDADGVLLTPRGSLPPDLPLVSGIRETDHPELRRDRIARAMLLLEALQEVRENLDEVDVSEPENLKVTYRIHERDYVLALGNRDFGERFQRFMRGYPEWKNNLPTRALIDLTHDSRVITRPLAEPR